MCKKRKQYAITPNMKNDLKSFWTQYKKEHNIADSVLVVLVDGRITVKRLFDDLQGR